VGRALSFVRRSLPAACLAWLLVSEGSALAAKSKAEAAAQGALKKVSAEYGAKKYATASALLVKALNGCGDDHCAPSTRAALLRDLGTMQFRMGDKAAAANSFDQAIAADPDVTFNPEFDKPDVHAAWDDATHRAAKAGGASAEPAEPEEPEAAAKPSSHPSEHEEEHEEKADSVKQPPSAYQRIWVGIAGDIDLVFLPSGQDLCKLYPNAQPGNPSNAYCTNPDGTDYPSRATPAENNALVQGKSGADSGGARIGNLRAMLTFDYALTPSLMLGARLGYVFGTYPGTAAVKDGRAFGAPLHLEVRGTYLFGDAPLAHLGFAPMVIAAAGIAEFDGHVNSLVAPSNANGTRSVEIWYTDTPWFLTLGGGVRYQLSLRAAFTGIVRGNLSFPKNGLLPTIGPEIGFQYGF
jgi:hypothetical protein